MTPERTCIGCRTKAPAADLLRCVCVDGVLVIGRSAPGRGASVHPATACLDLAERRRAWQRALRLDAPPDASAVRAAVTGLAGPATGV